MDKKITPLEALKNIKNLFIGSSINPTQQFEIIETELKENKTLKKLYKMELKNTSYYNNLALKYKKALEIIANKNVCIHDLKKSKTLEEYNGCREWEEQLTQAEYEPLKEALKWKHQLNRLKLSKKCMNTL